MMGTSSRTSWRATSRGATRPATPRMKSTLKTFDPTTLPSAMSGFPSSPAPMDTTSSGVEVP